MRSVTTAQCDADHSPSCDSAKIGVNVAGGGVPEGMRLGDQLRQDIDRKLRAATDFARLRSAC